MLARKRDARVLFAMNQAVTSLRPPRPPPTLQFNRVPRYDTYPRSHDTATEWSGSTAIPNRGEGAVKGAEIEQDGEGEEEGAQVGQAGWGLEKECRPVGRRLKLAAFYATRRPLL
jgi:hypothetical protein